MKPLFDLHTHTLSSGHAFSTLKENLEEAGKKGLLALGTSDHSPGMPGSAHLSFFENYKVLRPVIGGIRLLRGMEVNIIDFDGSTDGGAVMAEMDYVIASLHPPCFHLRSSEDITRAVIGTMKNQYIKIIGHPDDSRFPLDYDRLAEAAAACGVALEINSSSLRPGSTRRSGPANCRLLIAKAAQYGASVVMGSDAHIWYDVGHLTEAETLLKEMRFPSDSILNYELKSLDFITRKRK